MALRPWTQGHADDQSAYMKTSEVERLAYWLWQQRGMPLGSPEADWFLAEELLKRQYRRFELSIGELPLFSVSLGKRTR